MRGIELDEASIKYMQTPAAKQESDRNVAMLASGVPIHELNERAAIELERQARAASEFHRRARSSQNAAERRRQFVAQLTKLGWIIFRIYQPIVWLSAYVNIGGQWMMLNADRVASFIRTHLKGPVSFNTMRARRAHCKACDHRRGKFCAASTCGCGEHKFSELVHITRLSGIACPKGKWSHGLAHRLIERLIKRENRDE